MLKAQAREDMPSDWIPLKVAENAKGGCWWWGEGEEDLRGNCVENLIIGGMVV